MIGVGESAGTTVEQVPIRYSYQIGLNRLVGAGEVHFGHAHYTYAVVARRMVELLREMGLDVVEEVRPEMVPATRGLTTFEGSARPIHFIFKPTEHIRLLRGAYNIAIVYWEFDAISDVALHNVPFSNQLRMLQNLDEIWVACEYTKRVFEAAGLRNVHIVPCPVPLPSAPPTDRQDAAFLDGVEALPLNMSLRDEPLAADAIVDAGAHLSRFDRSSSKVFLAILNPHDWRKDIGLLVEAFCDFLAREPGHVLIVKCVLDDTIHSIRNLYDCIRPRLRVAAPFASDNILFISKRLSNEQMERLYAFSDHYLCTSRAEGQCLPLIEAMLRGRVPVATDNTAMEDYIRDDNAIVIGSFRKRIELRATEFGFDDLHWYQASLEGCVRSLEVASHLSAPRYEALSGASRDTARSLFSPQAVTDRIAARLAAI